MNYILMIDGAARLFATAANRDEALTQFGKALGKRLTDKTTMRTASMLLDEFDESPHPINIHAGIPVWEKGKHGVMP